MLGASARPAVGTERATRGYWVGHGVFQPAASLSLPVIPNDTVTISQLPGGRGYFVTVGSMAVSDDKPAKRGTVWQPGLVATYQLANREFRTDGRRMNFWGNGETILWHPEEFTPGADFVEAKAALVKTATPDMIVCGVEEGVRCLVPAKVYFRKEQLLAGFEPPAPSDRAVTDGFSTTNPTILDRAAAGQVTITKIDGGAPNLNFYFHANGKGLLPSEWHEFGYHSFFSEERTHNVERLASAIVGVACYRIPPTARAAAAVGIVVDAGTIVYPESSICSVQKLRLADPALAAAWFKEPGLARLPKGTILEKSNCYGHAIPLDDLNRLVIAGFDMTASVTFESRQITIPKSNIQGIIGDEPVPISRGWGGMHHLIVSDRALEQFEDRATAMRRYYKASGAPSYTLYHCTDGNMGLGELKGVWVKRSAVAGLEPVSRARRTIKERRAALLTAVKIQCGQIPEYFDPDCHTLDHAIEAMRLDKELREGRLINLADAISRLSAIAPGGDGNLRPLIAEYFPVAKHPLSNHQMISNTFDAERFAEEKAGTILKILGTSHVSFAARIMNSEIAKNSVALALFGG